MTLDERVQAVAQVGFTERQARFLVTVMLHAGVCVPRQYARFCGLVHGQKTRKFFAKLVRLGFAAEHDCRHNRARLYHLHQKALYRRIGEADSRFRRPLTLGLAIQRLMLLDAIVESPELVWLATTDEKVAHLTTLTRIEPEELPHVTTWRGSDRKVGYFPERLPIGIHPAGRGVLVYVFAGDTLDDFRGFLQRHAALLRALPVWTLRIVVPPHLAVMEKFAQDAVETQLLTPLHTDCLDEMRWYFEQARAYPAPTRAGPLADLDERFYRARTAFAAPRFKVLYRLWKQEGDAILAELGAPALANAVAAGTGRIDILSAGHRYAHLAPLVAVA
jgi:hypothetical protein